MEKILKDLMISLKQNKILSFKFIPDSSIFHMDGFSFEEYMLDAFNLFNIPAKMNKKTSDYGIDLFVDNYGLQLKRYYNQKVGVSAVQETYSGAKYYDVRPVLITTGLITSNAKTMAKKLNVELIDGVDMINWLNKTYVNRYKDKDSFYYMVFKKISFKKKKYKNYKSSYFDEFTLFRIKKKLSKNTLLLIIEDIGEDKIVDFIFLKEKNNKLIINKNVLKEVKKISICI